MHREARSRLDVHTTRNLDRRPGAAALAWVVAVLACLILAAPASAGPPATRLAFASGEIVPIPAAIPHEEGDMVDRRIVPNLRWLAQRYPIYITDGFSGRHPVTGAHVGCRGCHVRGSDHHNGLAVDIVALDGGGRCDRGWRGITRLARWAEPRQNRPLAPFRWVGYDGDANHGCGHHLHLSWEHAESRSFQIAEWVEVFAVGFQGIAKRPVAQQKRMAPTAPAGPPGGTSASRAGGLSAN